MVDPRCVDYIRTNKDKYPLDALKAALLKAGVPPADVEEAVRLAAGPPPEPIPATAPPMRRAPASFAEIFPASGAPAAEPPRSAPSPTRRAAPAPLPQGILPRMRAVILSPAAFFRGMPRGGGWREPLLFVLAMSLAFAVLQILLTLAFGWAALGPSRAAATVLAAVFSVAGALIASLIGVLVAAGIAHLIWMVLGSSQPFESSLRCVAFMSALMPVQALVRGIPVAGVWLAIPVSLYGIYLFIPASTEVHQVEKKKAAAAACVLGAIALFGLLSSAYGVHRFSAAARNRPPSLMEASDAANQTLPPLPAAPSQADLQKQVLAQISRLQAQAAAGAAGAAAGAGPAQAPDPAQAMQAVQAMTAALGALGAGAPAKTARPEDLEIFLPAEVPGLTRAEAGSGRQVLGTTEMAAAHAVFRSPDGGRVMIQISDAGAMAGLVSLAWSAAPPGQAPVRYKFCPAVEQYDAATRSGTFQIIASQRFAIKVTGQKVDQKALRTAMDAVDLGALSRLAQ